MGTLAAIREQRRLTRLRALREGAKSVVAGRTDCEVWLFGSLARGDWDAKQAFPSPPHLPGWPDPTAPPALWPPAPSPCCC